ncbi:hypothetical protein [Mucilaginibacter polytrichastri]|uniref:Uncharacterized protein n=1 Tax=Mucilaginibacter polytrichastri TaxID=1302689 RepID=A0A1Q6A4T9_9SPHI|nr:hypothetical protein [Mucilaginibacter polytrichastri]OKS89019.1 hypothetical protein RG47T_4499 [Mucilaginibacter polytrichastri]SFS95453.1 hypothetical protein SAMN04487890_10760 [Mucilaginibacter polytrichastri]
MKNKFLIFFIAIIAVSNFSLAQQQDFALSEHIFILTPNRKVNIDDIKRKSIVSLLGKPQKIKKEMSETDGLLSVYSYPNGEIDFDENGSLNSIEIKGTGWALILKTENKPEKSFSFNSTNNDLYSYFKGSFDKKHPDQAMVYIKSKSGEIHPYTWIVFKISKSHISSIIYAFNNY